MFQNLFTRFISSKRRKIRGTKRSKPFGKRSTKRRTRHVYKMRGGWGENNTPSATPQMFMKGGWGGAITSTNPV